MTTWIPKIVELYGKGGELQQKTIQRTENGPIEVIYPIPSVAQQSQTRNEVLEEVAVEIERFTFAFGVDTVNSFAAFVRGMKE